MCVIATFQFKCSSYPRITRGRSDKAARAVGRIAQHKHLNCARFPYVIRLAVEGEFHRGGAAEIAQRRSNKLGRVLCPSYLHGPGHAGAAGSDVAPVRKTGPGDYRFHGVEKAYFGIFAHQEITVSICSGFATQLSHGPGSGNHGSHRAAVLQGIAHGIVHH